MTTATEPETSAPPTLPFRMTVRETLSQDVVMAADIHLDWVGGYPFEVAKPEKVFAFFHPLGYEVRHLTSCAGGLGCNERYSSESPLRRHEPLPRWPGAPPLVTTRSRRAGCAHTAGQIAPADGARVRTGPR